jgi:Lipopolysaccharide kinase (Kdo/WaaP) family
MIKFKCSLDSISDLDEIKKSIENFKTSGADFVIGQRNSIKIFQLEAKVLNIKSFKKPNLINKFIYKYFRKSKAKRSYEFATILLEKGIGTPKPIAFYENFDFFGLKDSYYVCEHIVSDLTFRELVTIPTYEDHENILRQFTKFSFDMHEKGIEFLDHSPGNTLIKKEKNNEYSFYLVDLNRMKFHEKMGLQSRINNLSHLTPKKEMITIMSDEYAKLSGANYNLVFDLMWKSTQDFQYRFHRKKKIKSIIKFWKK